MTNISVKDNIMQFVKNNFDAMDRALNRMAIDIERLSKAQVPFATGHLASSGHYTRVGPLNYDVEYNSVYAAYQEFGGDGRRTITHYTTPGTKKFYLRDPGNEISAKAVDYIKMEVSHVTA